MASPQLEWDAFVVQNPNLSHDDPERNGLFRFSAADNKLFTRVLTDEITIPGNDNRQTTIRTYTASATGCSSGIVIFFHSGGFAGGSLETEDVSCRYMALGAPVTVISVEYPLSPAYLYPVPIDDGWTAVQYIMDNLSNVVKSHTIPADFVLSGTSSGGQLAAIISRRARDWLNAAKNSALAAKISLKGVLLRAPVTVRATDAEYIPPQFRGLHRSWTDNYNGAERDRESMIRNHDTLRVPLKQRTSPDAYPLWAEFGGLPKAYIQICENDILRDDAVCYAKGLRDAGVEVQETLYPGLPHIFWIYCHHLRISVAAQEDCVRGLKWLLGMTE